MRVDRVLNRRVGIVGLARSGLAAAKLIRRMGGKPFVSDVLPEEKLQKQVAELRASDIPYETAGHTRRLLDHSEFIVVSPGVPNDSPIILKAQALGIPIFSELELSSWLCDANLAAITGSNGKTTTTALLGRIFEAAGYENAIAGNIGYPISEVCDQISSDGWISLEVSSFQLERIFDFQPQIGVILNLTPDHLDRYGRFEDYAETKMRIAENMTSSEYLIINADDEYLGSLAAQTQAKVIRFSQKQKLPMGIFLDNDRIVYNLAEKKGDLGLIKDIKIPGPHNVYNAMAAGAAALVAGISENTIKHVFREFSGVEHRLEYVDTIAGVQFINDSKATNVDSVWYALQSVSGQIVLIMGGRYKGGDLTRLENLIRARVKHIILIGEAAEIMRKAFAETVELTGAGSLEEAVTFAFEIAAEGDTVLLSPACASFDMFTDFEHRGRVFKDAVTILKNRGQQ